MTRLRIDSAARAELIHEIRYYEATRPGTGRRFREAVDETFEGNKRNPKAGKPDEAGCRRMRVAGFPFSVVYREEKTELVAYAVRPDGREPGYWLRRTR